MQKAEEEQKTRLKERDRIWAEYLDRYPNVVDYYVKHPAEAQQKAYYWYKREQEKKREIEESNRELEKAKRRADEAKREADEAKRQHERITREIREGAERAAREGMDEGAQLARNINRIEIKIKTQTRRNME